MSLKIEYELPVPYYLYPLQHHDFEIFKKVLRTVCVYVDVGAISCGNVLIF